MPEKSRGKKPAKGEKSINYGPSTKNVSFEADLIDLDEKFEELKQPVYKGKKLDDPIRSPLVRTPIFCLPVSNISG
jgi:hypothetical protein